MENLNTNADGTFMDDKGPEAAEKISFTKEELDLYLQKESDKRVTKALTTAKTKWEGEIGDKMNSHLKDYEKRAQLTPEALKQLDLEEKFKLLENKEKQYERMTKKMELNTILANKGLSTVLSDFVYDDDMGVAEQKIATLEQLVLGMVNEEVEKRINSAQPRASINTDKLDKDSFSKLSIADRSQLYKTNPELFKQLSNIK